MDGAGDPRVNWIYGSQLTFHIVEMEKKRFLKFFSFDINICKWQVCILLSSPISSATYITCTCQKNKTKAQKMNIVGAGEVRSGIKQQKFHLFIPIVSFMASVAPCALACICCPACCIESIADCAVSLALSAI